MELAYELEPIKASKAKNIKLTKKNQTIKSMDSLGAHTLVWVLFKRFVRFTWANKVPITVNLFIVENGYFVARYFGVI